MAPVNFFHSMFSFTDLYLNNKLVTSNMDTYPYRAYLENLFSFGSDEKQNQWNSGIKMQLENLSIGMLMRYGLAWPL